MHAPIKKVWGPHQWRLRLESHPISPQEESIKVEACGAAGGGGRCVQRLVSPTPLLPRPLFFLFTRFNEHSLTSSTAISERVQVKINITCAASTTRSLQPVRSVFVEEPSY